MSSMTFDKVVLMVGGTKGIGRATALQLASTGAQLVLVARDLDAGKATVRAVAAAGGIGDFIAADMSLMSEVQRVAAWFKQHYSRLDLLIHSADLLRFSHLDTAEGIEISFALNYLSRFLLNSLLLDMMKQNAPARIVHIAAAGMPGRLDLNQIPPKPVANGLTSHNVGQRANDVYGIEMATRLKGTGVSIRVLNPGTVDTDIRRKAADGAWMTRIMDMLMKSRSTTPEQFAQIVFRLATELDTMANTGPLFNAKGAPIRISDQRLDSKVRLELWRKSETLAGITPTSISSAMPV